MKRIVQVNTGKATHYESNNEMVCGSFSHGNKTIRRNTYQAVTIENISCKKCKKIFEAEQAAAEEVIVEEEPKLVVGMSFSAPKGTGTVIGYSKGKKPTAKQRKAWGI